MAPAHPARLALVAAGKTNKGFAEWASLHPKYVSDVLNSRYPASPRFRGLLAAYLSRDEQVLFPPLLEKKQATAANGGPQQLSPEGDVLLCVSSNNST